ncbi:MAG TPA: hypothetical protein VJ020_09455 [Anaerolineales bacterium]|nr:hypothetical protein [Anaerolineales bacterium]
MAKRIREYHRPETMAEAAALYDRKDVECVPLLLDQQPDVDAYYRAEAVVDLGHLSLNYIKEENDVVRIGVLTPLQTLVESPLIQSIASGILSEAAQMSAHLGLRHLIPLHNLWYGDEALEVRIALSALRADHVFYDSSFLENSPSTDTEFRVHHVPDTFQGRFIEVRIPFRAGLYGGAARVARTPRDHPIVAAYAVVTVTAGVIQHVSVSYRVGGSGAVIMGRSVDAQYMQQVEDHINQHRLTSIHTGSGEYRQEMLVVVSRRAIELACKRAGVK